MLLRQIQRIPEFGHISTTELRGFASRASVLSLPADRWLVRGRRDMAGYLYLLKGSVRTIAPDRRLKYRPLGALPHFYPGCEAARTCTASQILRVSVSQREFLMGNVRGETCEGSDADLWLQRFLRSHMMARLQPAQWQALLAAFSSETHARGARIIEQGAPASRCYVVERGHLVVHRGATTLCHLGAGDFFGEDALILRARRNATVTALDDVRIHGVAESVFVKLMLNNLVRCVLRQGDGKLLNLGTRPVADAQHVTLDCLREQSAGLSPREDYFVIGGALRERVLCAFLLSQRGIRCHPVNAPEDSSQAGTVRSAAQVRSD
jgi:hypothetical protein